MASQLCPHCAPQHGSKGPCAGLPFGPPLPAFGLACVLCRPWPRQRGALATLQLLRGPGAGPGAACGAHVLPPPAAPPTHFGAARTAPHVCVHGAKPNHCPTTLVPPQRWAPLAAHRGWPCLGSESKCGLPAIAGYKHKSPPSLAPTQGGWAVHTNGPGLLGPTMQCKAQNVNCEKLWDTNMNC